MPLYDVVFCLKIWAIYFLFSLFADLLPFKMLDNELNHNGDVQLMNKPSSAIAHPFSEMCSSASLVVPETPKDGVVVRVRIKFRVGGGWVEVFYVFEMQSLINVSS